MKDETRENRVPSEWRETLSNIVECLCSGDYQLDGRAACVSQPTRDDATRLARNIDAYGQRLVSLPEQAWSTSVYRWQRGYWEIMVDLFVVADGASDLVMFVRVFEDSGGYRFVVNSVHVP